jgi:hypothetical protein
MAQMNVDLHKKLHKKMVKTPKQKSELETMSSEEQKNTNTQLFHLLLTFAIRMGFNIGHKELNDAGHNQHHDVHLDFEHLVHAQICMEEIYPDLKDRYFRIITLVGVQIECIV